MNIFLSYAQTDKEWVDEFSALLREANLAINLGISNLQFGKQWESALRQGIESADLVVSILTVHSLQSAWVLFELGAATGARKAVLPLLIGRNGVFPEIPKGMNGYRFLRAESPRQAAEQVARHVADQMAGV